MTVFQAPRQFLQRSVSRHRPPFLRAQKLSFCFYFLLMIYRLGAWMSNQIICLWLPYLYIHYLDLLQIWTNFGRKLELRQNTWQMEFNPEKCFIMCILKQRNPPFREYTFCNTTLAYVEKHPYLGVTLDANLRWNHHLHELSSKATKTLTLIKRNFWFCDEDAKCLLYKTLVRPKLEYASVLV